MLGHLKPRACQLSSASKNHYQHLYCSLCFSLRRQFGLPASFLISHELTLSLAGLADSSTMEVTHCACPAKLFCQQKPIHLAPMIDKAAQLCLLLVWLKLLDSAIDRPKFYKPLLIQSIEPKVQTILAGLSVNTRQFIDAYLLLIRGNNQTDFVMTTKMSGLLAQHIFQELSQQAQPAVAEISLLLGEIITVADALLDVEQDSQQQQYNPIIAASQQQHISLTEAYSQLNHHYQTLLAAINQQIASHDLTAENPVFTELLQQSLANLSRKIQYHSINHNQDDRRNSRRNNNRHNQRDSCLDDCCDSLDCCDCCGEGSQCCCSMGEGGCCECGECSCCECGGCDC